MQPPLPLAHCQRRQLLLTGRSRSTFVPGQPRPTWRLFVAQAQSGSQPDDPPPHQHGRWVGKNREFPARVVHASLSTRTTLAQVRAPLTLSPITDWLITHNTPAPTLVWPLTWAPSLLPAPGCCGPCTRHSPGPSPGPPPCCCTWLLWPLHMPLPWPLTWAPALLPAPECCPCPSPSLHYLPPPNLGPLKHPASPGPPLHTSTYFRCLTTTAQPTRLSGCHCHTAATATHRLRHSSYHVCLPFPPHHAPCVP